MRKGSGGYDHWFIGETNKSGGLDSGIIEAPWLSMQCGKKEKSPLPSTEPLWFGVFMLDSYDSGIQELEAYLILELICSELQGISPLGSSPHSSSWAADFCIPIFNFSTELEWMKCLTSWLFVFWLSEAYCIGKVGQFGSWKFDWTSDMLFELLSSLQKVVWNQLTDARFYFHYSSSTQISSLILRLRRTSKLAIQRGLGLYDSQTMKPRWKSCLSDTW